MLSFEYGNRVLFAVGPAGVQDGRCLVLRGYGEPGQHGGVGGDLFVEIPRGKRVYVNVLPSAAELKKMLDLGFDYFQINFDLGNGRFCNRR